MIFKKSLFTIFVCLVCTLCLTNCSSKQEPSSTETQDYLPSITVEEMQTLWNTCNQIDYIFYNLPISSSISDNTSARVHLKNISDSPVPATTKNNCGQAIGRVFYKTNGEDIMDAEIFFSSGCTFFVFYKKGQAIYSNVMTPDGVNHFNQIIATANNAKNSNG